jgi:tellurite methyltransferase
MFSPEGHCLFEPGDLRERLAGWELPSYVRQEFAAPRNTVKIFETAIARQRPAE